jgi:serine/threonine protein kinase
MSLEGQDLAALARLLDEALDLPAGAAREAWLAGLSPIHGHLRQVLRGLLARHDAHGGDDSFNTLPKFQPLPAETPASGLQPEFVSGEVIGPYRLIREIGRGGMSVVWLAMRTDEQLKRSVALKLPLVALNRGRLESHFARERDILAALTHPQIARLYDAGISAQGQPYLAMEFIEGTPLVEHCDHLRLDCGARLELFEQVLRAVQYAHSHLVVHRDLKPSNILVTAGHHLALLDFGIAKLLSDGNAKETLLTVFGGRALTPDYASPEQIAGEALGTPSDIYSLGVILYELLTGVRPYRLKRNSRGALEEAILDVDPVVPSRMISAMSARLRSSSQRQISRALRGDLDTIVVKALAKRPEDRYPTADALLQDLERYSRGEPIQARSAGSWYRARKFLTRNKLAVSLVAALLIALVTGAGVALWEAHAARLEARRAESVKKFLVGVFSQSDPEHARGKNITAGEILERGAARLDNELRDEPEVLGELHGAIADIYSSLGSNVDGLTHAERAISLLEKTGRQRSPEYLNALWQRAQALEEEEKWGDSALAWKQLRRAAHRVAATDGEWDAIALRGLAWGATQQGRLEDARQLYGQAMDIALRVAGERSVLYLKTLSSSIQADLDLGLLPQAEAAARKLISMSPSVPEYVLTDRLVDRYQLAVIAFRQRKYQESIDVLERLLPEMDEHIGPRHDRTIKARGLLAQELAEVGSFERALSEERANLESARSDSSGDVEQLALQELTFAKILRGAGRFEQGIPYARKGVDYFDDKYATPTFLRERSRWILGDLLVGAGRVDEGIETLERTLRNQRALPGGGQSAAAADVLMSLGHAYQLKGDASLASRNIEAACRMYAAILGPGSEPAVRCHAGP